MSIRYGQEGGGGQGGGGNGAAAAGVLEAISGMITGVGSVVYMGRMTESKVFTSVADYQNHFQDNLNDLNTLREYLRKYKRWLADPGNLAPWCSPGVNNPNGTPHAPPRHKACTELYHGKPQLRNPGGHRCGSPACQCKTNACAYRNPARADQYKSWIKKASGRGWGAGWTNPPHLHGRGVTWRMGYLREAWNYLMTVAPVAALWNMQNPTEQISVAYPTLVEEDVLRTVFPDNDGEMPLAMQDHWWNTILTLNALGLPPYTTPDIAIPFFVFGYTEAQAKTLFPDDVRRRSVFSPRFLLSLQRMYTEQLLATSGATDVFAGVSYGAEIPPAGADAETMHRLIEEVAATDNPITNGEPTPTVALRSKLIPRFAPAMTPKRLYRNFSDEDLRRRGSPVMLGELARRQRVHDAAVDDWIAPNYMPLAMGAASLLTGLFVYRRRTN